MGKTVAIIYGWSEGQWHSKLFREQLIHNGYEVVKEPEKAHAIIAHSEGCYWSPKNNRADLIILIGLPYWPGRNLATSVILNLKANYSFAKGTHSAIYWTSKLIRNVWYIFTKPRSSYWVLTKHKLANLPTQKKAKVILIRNKMDTFLHPDIQKILPITKNYELVQHEGVHDDCWNNPKPYIDLLLKELERDR